jgi:hypothetical protein
MKAMNKEANRKLSNLNEALKLALQQSDETFKKAFDTNRKEAIQNIINLMQEALNEGI